MGGRFEEDLTDRLDLFRCCDCERRADGRRQWRRGRCGLEWIDFGCDWSSCSRVTPLGVDAIQDHFATELLGDSSVMRAEIAGGRNGLAAAAIAKPRGAERSHVVDAESVTPPIARAETKTQSSTRMSSAGEACPSRTYR